MADKIEDHLEGARNIFFGILKGLDTFFDFPLPTHVYHYTSWNSFYSMIESNSIRLHTINNFSDTLERKIVFGVEARVKGTIKDEDTGNEYDLAEILNEELSGNHVFIQSNAATADNKYLWKNYAAEGKGVCLKLSTDRYIEYLNFSLPDFDLLPQYLKCCFVSYDSGAIGKALDMIFPVIEKENESFGNAGTFFWFF
jgi:hypothetical protein